MFTPRQHECPPPDKGRLGCSDLGGGAMDEDGVPPAPGVTAWHISNHFRLDVCPPVQPMAVGDACGSDAEMEPLCLAWCAHWTRLHESVGLKSGGVQG